jgi:hypothetical protein
MSTSPFRRRLNFVPGDGLEHKPPSNRPVDALSGPTDALRPIPLLGHVFFGPSNHL